MLPQGSDTHSSPWDSPRFERGRGIPKKCDALQHCTHVDTAEKKITWFECYMDLWLPQYWASFSTDYVYLCFKYMAYLFHMVCSFHHYHSLPRYLGTSTQIPPGPRYLAGRYEIRNPRSEIPVCPCEVPSMLRYILYTHICICMHIYIYIHIRNVYI